MNWPFKVEAPVKTEQDATGQLWTLDAQGRTVIEPHLADEFNALHAEVERLREKVSDFSAVFDKWWDHYTDQDNKQEGWGWISDAWDRLKPTDTSAAALFGAKKEAGDDSEAKP